MNRINPKLYNWASVIEPNTLAQAELASTMPFIFPHLALMPDAHLGKGATVGSVIPTEGAIIPAAVGVDIGCGMIAVRTQFTKNDLEGKDLLEVMGRMPTDYVSLSGKDYSNEPPYDDYNEYGDGDEHQHQFVIPVEWKHVNVGNFWMVTKLRCSCGEETER